MTVQEKADMIYSQNEEMMKELGVSKEAFRVCFEKGYNFEQDEREAKGEMSKNDKEATFSAMYDELEGDQEDKFLFVISQDKHKNCVCFCAGNMKVGVASVAATCLKNEYIKKTARCISNCVLFERREVMTWSEQKSNGAGGFFICTEELTEGVRYYIDLSSIEWDKELLFVRKGVAVELLGSYDTLEAAKEAAQEHYSKTIK